MNRVFVYQRWVGAEGGDEARTDAALYQLVNFRGFPVMVEGTHFVLGYLYMVSRPEFKRLSKGVSGGVYDGIWQPIMVGGDEVLAPLLSGQVGRSLSDKHNIRTLREINAEAWYTEATTLSGLGRFQDDR